MGRLHQCDDDHSEKFDVAATAAKSKSSSVPYAIDARASAPADTCTSSSLSASPLWPQSFGRTMDIYSRSSSLRSRPDGAGPDGALSGGLEPTFSEQAAGPEKDFKEPLLGDYSGPYDPEYGEHRLDSKGSGRVSNAHGGGVCGDPQRSSFLQALFNGMNALAGVGILSTPYATAKGGWLGLGLLLFFAVVCCYTAILLRRCLDSDPHISSYPDVGEAAFGKWGRWAISVTLYLELYAVVIEFLILEGDNLAQLFPGARLAVGGVALDPHQAFVVLSALCMLPTVWLRELSVLSYVSAGGVVASLLIVLAVGWVGLLDGVGFHQRGALVHWSGLPVAVGLYSFCYCGHAVFPSIYGSMRNRNQFSHVLVVCFILCTLINGGIAVMGYLMFGDALRSQITLNLPRAAPASYFAIWVTLVTPFAKYALTLTPMAVALEELLPAAVAGSPKRLLFWGTVLRTLLVASTVAVALAVPFFGLLMALIGSALSVTVSIVLPCMCYLKIFGWRLSRREAALIVLVLCTGLVAGAIGTYYSVKAIVDHY